MTNPEPQQGKQTLRRRMRALAPPSPEVSAALRGQLEKWLGGKPEARTIAAFAPMADEVDLLPLLSVFPDRRWVLPRVVGEEIDLHEIGTAEELAPGTFGIPEPAPEAPVVPPGEVAVFLCPGLAFDAAGRRLGRGRGYYDRLLAGACKEAEFVGIAPCVRVVPEVPALARDIRMGWLAGEDGVVRATETRI